MDQLAESKKKWLTFKEAAEHLGMSCGTLRNRYLDWNLPHYKPAGQIYFKVAELDEWIESSRKGGFYANSRVHRR